MKTTLLALFSLLFCLLFSEATYAQTKIIAKPNTVQVSKKVETTSLKPEDGMPATFSTQEDLDATVPVKIAKLKEMIDSGQYSGERLKFIREDIWRFENAVVVKK